MKIFPDYGFLDVLNARLNGSRKNHLIGNTTFRKHLSIKNSEHIWCVFLPWRMSYKSSKRIGLLPSNHITYDGPASIVHPDPHISRKSLFEIERDFEENVNSKFKKISILAFSASQYQAVWIANHFSINQLVLICPGTKMGQILWESIGTKEVKKRAEKKGFEDGNAYDNVLSETNPIYQLKNLPKKIEVHLGTHDKYVPYKYGRGFVEEAREAGKEVAVHTHKNRGHMMTIYEFGLSNEL